MGSFRVPPGIPPGLRFLDFPATGGPQVPSEGPPRKVDPAQPSKNNPNHPGRQGGGGNSGGGNSGGGNSGGGNGEGTVADQHSSDTMERYKPRDYFGHNKRVEINVPVMPLTLLTATVSSYATYYKIINGLVAAVGRSAWRAALTTAARLGAFVGTRAVAGAYLGPWGVGAATVASIVVFFLTMESAEAGQESPVDKYRREVEKLWRTYTHSSDPSVQLEALRKLFLVIWGMQLCLDAAIHEQAYLTGKVIQESPERKSALLPHFVKAVEQYLNTAAQSRAAMAQVLSEAGRLLLAIQIHYGWNAAYMQNRHALYQQYFRNFNQFKGEWEERIANIRSDATSVDQALTNLKFL